MLMWRHYPNHFQNEMFISIGITILSYCHVHAEATRAWIVNDVILSEMSCYSSLTTTTTTFSLTFWLYCCCVHYQFGSSRTKRIHLAFFFNLVIIFFQIIYNRAIDKLAIVMFVKIVIICLFFYCSSLLN